MPLVAKRIQGEENGETVVKIYQNWRTAKYFSNVDGDISARLSIHHYGLIDVALVRASVTQAQHTFLSVQTDVISFPGNINSTIPAALLPAVRNRLEALRIPAGWATTETTWRQLLRVIGSVFQIAQRHRSLHGEALIPEGADLSISWSEVPAARRGRVAATVESMGYTTDGITGSTTVRQTLRILAQQRVAKLRFDRQAGEI